MPKETKEKWASIRVRQSFADEIELIADYLQDITGRFVARDVLLSEWSRGPMKEHLEKAIAHKMEKLKALGGKRK